MVHQPEDTRPQLCRNRLRDEGQAYPRSGCAVCGNGGLMGCPHERRPSPPTTGSGVKPPPQSSAEAMVRVALEMSSRVVAAVEAERDKALADLQQATAERDEARKEARDLREGIRDACDEATHHRNACLIAQSALATANAELAQLQAEVEAKDRAILLLLPFVDYAAGEGLMFVETEDGEHPEMDAADIVIAAAKEIGLELSSDASEAFLAEGYAAIRAARAATAREG